MKKQHLLEIVVGIFVLLGLGTIFIMVMSIADQQNLFVETYRINATFTNVSGLKAGAPVYLSGVEAGTVESISFTENGLVQVVLLLRADYRERIRTDSVARIGSVGLLGDKSVEISMGSLQAAVIRPGENLKTETQESLAELLDGLGSVRSKLEGVLDNLVTITGALISDREVLITGLRRGSELLESVNSGQGTMGKLLKDEKLYDSLVLMVKDGGGAARELEQAARATLPLLAEIGHAAENIRASSEHYPEIARSAEHLLKSTNQTMEKIGELANRLEASTESLPEIMESVKNTAINVEEASKQLPEAASSARTTADEAGKVIDAAKSNWLLKGAFPETGDIGPMETDSR
ncbi:MAG: MlaD family protein [Pseudomonadota bacterium]|jgi:phospholipid/cholesterol/gamma-HCH transport system substrate-binding protein